MNLKKLFTTVAVFVLLIASSTFAQTFFVNNLTGNDANSGLSTAQAKATLNSAMIAAPSGSTISVQNTTVNYIEASPVITNNYTFTSTDGTPVIFNNALSIGSAGAVAITGVTATTNATITAAGHGLINGNTVFIYGTGDPVLDAKYFTVTVISATQFSINNSTASAGSATGAFRTQGAVTFTGPFEFDGGLNLNCGTIANANNLTVKSPVYRTELGSITAGQLAYSGTVAFTYENVTNALAASGTTTITTGLEFPTTATTATTLSTLPTAGSLTLKLDQNRQINGILFTDALATGTAAPIDLNTFTLTLYGTSTHSVRSDVTNGTLAFTMTTAGAAINAPAGSVKLPVITATTSTTTGRTLTIGAAISTLTSLTANSAATITSANTGAIGNITLNGSGAISTTNQTGGATAMAGAVLASSTSTGNITLNNGAAAAYKLTSITQSGTGNITFGGNVNAINVTGNVLLNTAFTYGLSTNSVAAVTNAGWITFTAFPVTIGGNLTNSATFAGNTDRVNSTNGQITFAANTVTVTGATLNNASSTVTFATGGSETADGDIVFANAANALTFAGVTNSAVLPTAAVSGGRIIATGTGAVTATTLLNNSTYAGANIDFSASTGIFTATSVTESGATKGGDILLGNGNVVGTTAVGVDFINSRGDTGADIIVGTAGTAGVTVTANNINNSGKSNITFTSTTTGGVTVTVGISQTGAGTTSFLNTTSAAFSIKNITVTTGTLSLGAAAATTAAFTLNNVTVSGGELDFGNGTGAINVSVAVINPAGVFSLTNGTVDFGTGARAVTVATPNIYIGGLGTKVAFTQSTLTNLVIDQPIPNVNQNIYLGTLDQSFPGYLSVTNPAVIPAPYVIFQSAAGASGTNGNLYILNTGGAANGLTFNNGSAVVNFVQLNNARIYVGKNGTTNGGGFQNTSGYVTANGGFVMMAAGTPVAQAVNAGAVTSGATFGNFGVQTSSGIANSVTFGAAGAVMAGDFYLASGDVNPANLFFNGPSPYPTIYRTEGTFSAPITVGNITGYINVTYYGGDKVTSNEVPTTKLWNLTVATTNGAKPGFGIIAMTGNITVNGTLTINANQALYTGVAPILTIAGASAVVNGYLVDPGTTNVYLAAATGTTFTGSGFLPSLQVNNGSLGNTVTGYTGLYSYGFGADGVWGGSGGNADNFTVAAGNIVYQAGADAGSSLTVGFQNTGNAHFGNLTMNTANETYTQTTNAIMSGSITQTGGTIALGDYTLTHQGTAFTSNGTALNGSAITSTVNGGLIFPTTATTLTITGAADMIAANVSFAPTSNAANSNYSLAAGFDLTISGNVTLTNSPDGTKGAVVDITNGRTLILGGNNVTVSSKSSFTAVGGTGILDLTNTAPNTLLTFTVPASSSVANLQLDGNVTLAGGITGSTLTATTSFVHNSGLLTFGSANLQIGNATAATFSRTGATATYSGDGYLIWNSTNAAGFSHSTVAAAGAMTINSLQLKTNFTLQNARALNVVKNLYLNGGSLTNSVSGGTTGYVFMGDATNVPLIQVVEPNDVVTNALQFNNANADYTFTGVGPNTITATVWPATATLARNIIVNITAAGILNIPARTINGDLTLTSGVLTWDSPTVVTIGSGSTITRTAAGSLNYDANANLTTGTLTAPNVNLVYTGNTPPVVSPVGDTGIEYSEPVIVTNFTMGTTAAASQVNLTSARTIAGVVTINNAASILNVNANTTFSAAQTLAVGTINVLPAVGIVPAKTLTLGAAATLPTVTGNVTSNFPLTIVGGHSLGTLTVGNDFTIGANATLVASSNIVLVGGDSKFTVPANTTIGALTLNKTANTNMVTLIGGNLTLTNVLTFTLGDLVTGSNVVNIFTPTTGAVGAGAASNGMSGAGPNSMIVGNVGRALVYTGAIATSTESRVIFPVGNGTTYRPAAITFNPAFGVPTNPNTTIVVGHVDSNPGGSQALPIKDGVATGIDVSRYPSFYWNIYTAPNSVGPSTPFDLELTAGIGFTGFDSPSNVRIIRRHGAVGDVTNDWLLQGVNTAYDNEVSSVTGFTAINRGANAGLRSGGAVFTLGLSSNISVKNAIAKQWLVIPQGAKLVSLANVFQGNIGTLSYKAQSSNPAVATAEIVGTSVKLTPLTIGEAYVTITAIDAANNDFFAYTFAIDSRNTDVATTEEIPTEFSLSQNFPNPFNPTTNIKFALPKESNVTLKIYNILGEEVANLVNKVMPAGYHTVNFDATRLASGMYIYRIEAGSFVQVKKMLLMK